MALRLAFWICLAIPTLMSAAGVARVTIHAVDRDGRSLRPIRVLSFMDTRTGAEYKQQFSEEIGSGIPEGSYAAFLLTPAGKTTKRVEVTPPETFFVFNARPGIDGDQGPGAIPVRLPLRGQVTPWSPRPARSRALLVPTADGGLAYNRSIDIKPDGTFLFPHVPAGLYAILVIHETRVLAAQQIVVEDAVRRPVVKVRMWPR